MQVNEKKAAAVLAAARAGDVERLRTLLPPCGDPAEDDTLAEPGGETPLMAAAASGHEAVVELLLQCGADPTRRDAQGRTAAFYAREAGHPHLAERLDTVVDKEDDPVNAGGRRVPVAAARLRSSLRAGAAALAHGASAGST